MRIKLFGEEDITFDRLEIRICSTETMREDKSKQKDCTEQM
jgi:hypothetical protein